MSRQNIYDNQEFFDGYMALRETDTNLNDLLEQPAMLRLLPDLTGKTVLDLGCGYGRNCTDFIKRGAERVVGVDISQKMLQVAREENSHERISYINMSMTDIDKLEGNFDLIYSSLAFHYVEDFRSFVSKIYSLLNEGGMLLFSQEHPITTATVGGGYYVLNEKGEKCAYTFSDYNRSGKREENWFVNGVIKYHRTFSGILTTLISAGFIIEKVVEPLPEDWAIEKSPKIVKEFIKPCFLIVRVRKG